MEKIYRCNLMRCDSCHCPVCKHATDIQHAAIQGDDANRQFKELGDFLAEGYRAGVNAGVNPAVEDVVRACLKKSCL